MMKNKRLFLLLIILVVLTVALFGGYLVYSKFKKSGGSPTQTINLQQLRRELTPEIRQCIIDKLGEAEAQKLLEEAKQTKTISLQTMIMIRLCLGGGPEGPLPAVTAPTSLPTSDSGLVSNPTNSPIFGVQVVFGKNPVPNQAFLSPLNVKVTTLWLYYPTGGAGQAWVDSQKQLVESTRQKTGLDIYVHIMPNNPTKQPAFHMPTDMSRYTQTLTALASTLKADGVRYYSIGNEFSGYTFSGTADDYVALLRESGRAIKTGNPDALILDSGMAGETYVAPIAQSMIDSGNSTGALNFTQQFLKSFSAYPVPNTVEEMQTSLQSKLAQDVITWHEATFTRFCPYYDVFELHDYQGWETMTTIYDWIKTQMQKSGCTKPIQLWELGYSLDVKKQIDPSEQASSVAKMLTIAAAEGTQMINYFPLKGTGNMFRGLVDDNNQLLPAGVSLEVVSGKLTGVTQVQTLNLGQNVSAYKFTKQGKNVFVVWSLSDITVQLPFIDGATITDIQGNSSKINSNRVSVGTFPIFIESQ